MPQTNTMQRIEINNNFCQHLSTVGGLSGRSNVTDCPYRKPHQYFTLLPLLEGAMTKGSLTNGEECGIEHSDRNAVPKTPQENSTYNIATATKQRDGKTKATLSEGAVRPLSKAAS